MRKSSGGERYDIMKEVQGMKNYILSPEAMVMISGSSAGTQPKYYESGYWYKANQNGYEARSEYLASLVLSCSNVTGYVSYELCTINNRPGCRSASFLAPTEAFISFQRLYDMYQGGELSGRIRSFRSIGERIKFVTDFINTYTGIDVSDYLSKILNLDCLTLNTDRHFNNLGIVVDREKNLCRPAPIFDNGDCLLSNFGKFPVDSPLEENIERAYGQPFSASLEMQAKEAGFSLKIDFDRLGRLLDQEPDSRAKDVLMLQLKKYRAVFS